MWIIALGFFAAGTQAPDEPPVAGKPPGFSGAIGDFKFFTTSATPTELRAGEPIWFKVSITCDGDFKGSPTEPELRKLPEYADQFVISNIMTFNEARGLPTYYGNWEFTYELRPISADVTEIPALRFDYYRPGVTPPEKGYQTRYSDPIPIKVHPRVAVESGDIAGDKMRSAPDSVYQLIEGAAVLWQVDSHHKVDPSDETVLKRAETAFRAGKTAREDRTTARSHFAAAASDYALLRQQGFRGGALLRNLGNAYLLSGDLPNAILAYRQGLRLDGSDRATRSNLEYARSQVVPPAVGERDWHAISAMIRVITFFALAAGNILLGVWWLRREAWLLRSASVIAICAAICATALLITHRQQRLNDATPFIVMTADDIKVRTGDGELYPVRDGRSLNRGAEARLLFTGSKWLQIELVDGTVGWIPSNAALIENLSEKGSDPLHFGGVCFKLGALYAFGQGV